MKDNPQTDAQSDDAFVRAPLSDDGKRSTAERKQRFLAELMTHANVTRVATSADISRMTPYQWRYDDPVFARDFEIARGIGLDHIESAVIDIASGDQRIDDPQAVKVQLDAAKFLLSRLRSNEYSTQRDLHHSGRVGTDPELADIAAKISGVLAAAGTFDSVSADPRLDVDIHKMVTGVPNPNRSPRPTPDDWAEIIEDDTAHSEGVNDFHTPTTRQRTTTGNLTQPTANPRARSSGYSECLTAKPIGS